MDDFINAIRNLFGKIGNDAKQTYNNAKNAVGNAASTAWKGFTDTTQSVGNWIDQDINKSLSGLAKDINKAFDLPDSNVRVEDLGSGNMRISFDHEPTTEELEKVKRQIERDRGITFKNAATTSNNTGTTGTTGTNVLNNLVKGEEKTTPVANMDTKLSTEPKATETTTVETKTATPTTTDEDEIITYTYKPGDTFGQVLLNLGLSDGTNLWGQGGDVEYYTRQLIDQNMLDYNGNVKLGIPFKLRRRRK